VKRDTPLAFSERLRRVHAIIKADFLIRFRRPSTLVAFLLLSGLAYISVPDPATGNALMVIDGGRRALYDSAAIGMATALIVTMFVGLAGFYVISNAIAHDVRSRCGFVIASTTMRAGEYLISKLAGNIVFLGTFTAGFMISSMAMLVVRNEAGLEPWLFVKQYLLLVPPVIILVAVLAIVFESIPFLSGRGGDVIYFVLYLSCLGFPAALVAQGQDPGFARYFDFGGIALTMEQMRPLTKNLSIGGDFDPVKPLFIVPGLALTKEWMLPRLVSLVTPLLLLVVALESFHRFDPARVRRGSERGRTAGLSRVNNVLKPPLHAILAFDPFVRWTPARPSLLRAAATDARVTFMASPVLLVFALALVIATVTSQPSAFMHGVLPLAFFTAGLAIADMPCRERRAGTLGLIQSAPLLKAHFVRWKLIGTTFVALTVLLVPLVRVAVSHPTSLIPAAVGLFLVAAMATSLGVISVTPKTFTVVFLTMLYIVTNARGASRALDFAGFYGVATPSVTVTYVVIALACVVAAQAVYKMHLRRDGG
jgi:hypothetical protein